MKILNKITQISLKFFVILLNVRYLKNKFDFRIRIYFCRLSLSKYIEFRKILQSLLKF